MTKVLFDKHKLNVVGVDREALPFEFEVREVSNLDKLTKVIQESKQKQSTNADGEKLYLLPQDPIEVIEQIEVDVETTNITEFPITITVVSKEPLMQDGKQVEYEQMQEVVTEATYDEEGNVLTEESSELVGTGNFIKCFVMEEKEEPKLNDLGNPLFIKKVMEDQKVLQEVEPTRISELDEGYVEDLEPSMESYEVPKLLTFNDHQDQFSYDEVVAHKQAYLVEGTLFKESLLFEKMDGLLSTELSSFKADIGFDSFIVHPGGEARTIKLVLPRESKFVTVKVDHDNPIEIEVGRTVSTFAPVNASSKEAMLDIAAKEVYVKFTNNSDKYVEVQSLALLV